MSAAASSGDSEASPTRFYDLSERDDWETPPDLIADLEEALGGFDLDPCAKHNTSIGEVNYRLEDGHDGLVLDWYGRVFVNPPFSYKVDWMEKAVEEVEAGWVNTVVLITPDNTDMISGWHEYIAPHAEVICFCEGRVKYHLDGEEQGSPTFGTAISVFGEVPDELLRVLHDWGHVVTSVEGLA